MQGYLPQDSMHAMILGMASQGFCSNCGHVIGARCSLCKREMLCGSSSVPCPVAGCLEGVIPDAYGGREADSSRDVVEHPWMDVDKKEGN